MSNALTRHFYPFKHGQLHVRLQGNTDKPALLLLHQAPSDSEMFEGVMALLSSKFFCIAPDFPGSGHSTSAQGVSITEIGESIHQLCIEQDWNIQAVFGHHSGGAVAAELAARHFTALRALVLSGPPLLTEQQRESLPDSVVNLVMDEQGEYLQRGWDYFRAKDAQVNFSVSQRELICALRLKQGYKALYQAVCDYDFAGALKLINCPTLVFAGDRDALKGAVIQSLALLSNGTKAPSADTSTYVCDTHPQLVSDLISTFYINNGGEHHGS